MRPVLRFWHPRDIVNARDLGPVHRRPRWPGQPVDEGTLSRLRCMGRFFHVKKHRDGTVAGLMRYRNRLYLVQFPRTGRIYSLGRPTTTPATSPAST